jgi:hypothetical protein
MPRIQEPAFRGIPFAPYDMADRGENPPLSEKIIDAVPSIEGNAKTILFKNTVHIGKAA